MQVYLKKLVDEINNIYEHGYYFYKVFQRAENLELKYIKGRKRKSEEKRRRRREKK